MHLDSCCSTFTLTLANVIPLEVNHLLGRVLTGGLVRVFLGNDVVGTFVGGSWSQGTCCEVPLCLLPTFPIKLSVFSS